jgi:hypothetical protein
MSRITISIVIGSVAVAIPFVCAGQAQKTFASAESAAQALIVAVQKDDLHELTAIFGSTAQGILTSGDWERDKAERAEFALLASVTHQLQPDPMNRNREVLSVGEADWQFPVPVVLIDGRWRFDASVGATEMRARRIGANELDVIEICSGYVEAQHDYAASDRERDGIFKYARHIDSSPGKNDGLYWDTGPPPLVPRGFAEGSVDGKAAKPYHGYYFRVLTAQGPNASGGPHSYLAKGAMVGGFGLVAWPSEYAVSGIHTFIVNQDGVVYEKDLGKRVSAPPVKVFDPDPSWKRVD